MTDAFRLGRELPGQGELTLLVRFFTLLKGELALSVRFFALCICLLPLPAGSHGQQQRHETEAQRQTGALALLRYHTLGRRQFSLSLGFGLGFFLPQPFLIGRTRSGNVGLHLLDQDIALVGEELAAFLQREPWGQQQRLVPALLLPLPHAGADVLAAAERLAVVVDPLLEHVPLADQRLVADLHQALGRRAVLARDEEARLSSAERADDGADGVVLLGIHRTGARILAALTGGDEAHEQAPGRGLLGGPELGEDVVGAFGYGPVDAASLAVGIEGEARALAAAPGLLERIFQQRQLAEIVADLVQQRCEERRVNREVDRFGRFLNSGGEVLPAHGNEVDLARRNSGSETIMLQELAVEVGTDGKDDRAGAGGGGLEQEVDKARDVGFGLLGRKRGLV